MKSSFATRQERLNTIVGCLSGGDFWTTAQLAKRCNTSQRTLNRDIVELKEQGYPIETERGAGGGITMQSRFGLGRSMMSDEEVVNTFISFTISEQLKTPVITSNIQALKAKFVASLSSHQREQVNRLKNRVLVGGAATTRLLSDYHEPNDSVANELMSAFYRNKCVTISYQSENKEVTERTIEVNFILLNWPIWYVLAWDRLRADVRLFRMDRVTRAHMVEEKFLYRPNSQMLEGLGQYFSQM